VVHEVQREAAPHVPRAANHGQRYARVLGLVPGRYCSPRHGMSRGPRRKPGASSYTRKRLSLIGARAKAWCLLIHAEASLSLIGCHLNHETRIHGALEDDATWRAIPGRPNLGRHVVARGARRRGPGAYTRPLFSST